MFFDLLLQFLMSQTIIQILTTYYEFCVHLTDVSALQPLWFLIHYHSIAIRQLIFINVSLSISPDLQKIFNMSLSEILEHSLPTYLLFPLEHSLVVISENKSSSPFIVYASQDLYISESFDSLFHRQPQQLNHHILSYSQSFQEPFYQHINTDSQIACQCVNTYILSQCHQCVHFPK